jgi:hypothetical protein
MKTLSIARRSFLSRQRQPLSKILQNGFILLAYISLFLVFVSGITFMLYSNQVAMKGHDIKKLENEQRYLLTRNKTFNWQSAEASAFENIQNSPLVKKMVKATRQKFIRGDTMTAQENKPKKTFLP